MLVSFLIPVRNGEDTIDQALESVLSQGEEVLEVVVVDDGSTDGTASRIEGWAERDGRVRLVRRPPGGIVSALNAGLALCRGQFVARMDADDISLPGRVRRQVEFLRRHREVDLAGCLVEAASLSGKLSPGVIRYVEWSNSLVAHGEIVREIFVESPIVHPTFMARRSFFEEMGGYREVPWAEDYDLILRAACRGKRFGKVPEKLLLWRDHPGRLVRRDPRCKRRALFRAKAHFFRLMKGISRVGVVGAGTSGKKVARALVDEGVEVEFFVDNRESPPGRAVMGRPAFGFPEGIPGDFLRKVRGIHLVLAVGEEKGRDLLVKLLGSEGFVEGRDFTRFL